MATNFRRDITFLNQGVVPLEPSGLRVEKLDYKGDSENQQNNLTDENVQELCEALQQNDEFSGPLDLSNNDLTNLVSYNLFFYFHSFYQLERFVSATSSFSARVQKHHETQS